MTATQKVEPEFTVFDGVRYRLEHSEVVTFWSAELKREVSYTAVRGKESAKQSCNGVAADQRSSKGEGQWK